MQLKILETVSNSYHIQLQPCNSTIIVLSLMDICLYGIWNTVPSICFEKDFAHVLAALYLPIGQFMQHSCYDSLNLSHGKLAHGNDWLKNNHLLANIYCLKFIVLNFPGPIFMLLVTYVKFTVFEPTKPISTRCFQ